MGILDQNRIIQKKTPIRTTHQKLIEVTIKNCKLLVHAHIDAFLVSLKDTRDLNS